jgi:16S rRNA (cytosine967-C5)-methyltransferase
VIERVERDRAFAAAALGAEIERHPGLDPRDRALATELVYGALRTRRALLEELGRHAPRGLDKLDSRTRAHLLVAAYQLLVLDRIPPHAATDAAVGSVRRERGARLAGFANALLRRLAAGGARLTQAEAIIQSAPAWLLESLEASVGPEEARALLGAGAEPSVAVRVRLRDADPPPAWFSETEPGKVSPLARLLKQGGDPRRLEGYAEGRFAIQEEGAQLLALAVGARPGERVLDACAGRGQKSSLVFEQLAGEGELWATDLHAAKLAALEREFARLRLPRPRTLAIDWSAGTGQVPADFDRVLVDAPCTGSGTLRRRPEIALRLEPGDPARLSQLAEAILRSAASRARPAGRVIFAVCSVLREECEALVERVGDLLAPAPFDAKAVERLLAPGATHLRLLPLQHGTDGYFVASFTRK